MSNRQQNRHCYFGCLDGGVLHGFPDPVGYKFNDEQNDRYQKWKRVLNKDVIERGDAYIKVCVHLCHRHFEECYKSASGRLTRNAIPTLNMEHRNKSIVTQQSNEEIDTKLSNEESVTKPINEEFQAQLSADNCFTKLSNKKDVTTPSNKDFYTKLSNEEFLSKLNNEDFLTKLSNEEYVTTLSYEELIVETSSKDVHIQHSDEADVTELCQDPFGTELVDEVEVAHHNHEVEVLPDTDSIYKERGDEDESAVPGEETFSWHKSSEKLQIQAEELDSVADNLSMYCDDEEPLSPPRHIQPKNKTLTHEEFRCNVCDGTISRFRYTCVQCNDFDLCSACENNRAHQQHYVLRVPAPRPFAEVQFVLTTIRRHLMKKLNLISEIEQDWDMISIKSEVKSECEDVDDDDWDSYYEPKNKPPDDDTFNNTKEPTFAEHLEAANCSMVTNVEKQGASESRAGSIQRRAISTDYILKVTDEGEVAIHTRANTRERESECLVDEQQELGTAARRHDKPPNNRRKMVISTRADTLEIESECRAVEQYVFGTDTRNYDDKLRTNRRNIFMNTKVLPDSEKKCLVEEQDVLRTDVRHDRELPTSSRKEVMNARVDVQEIEIKYPAVEQHVPSTDSRHYIHKPPNNKNAIVMNTTVNAQECESHVEKRHELSTDERHYKDKPTNKKIVIKRTDIINVKQDQPLAKKIRLMPVSKNTTQQAAKHMLRHIEPSTVGTVSIVSIPTELVQKARLKSMRMRPAGSLNPEPHDSDPLLFPPCVKLRGSPAEAVVRAGTITKESHDAVSREARHNRDKLITTKSGTIKKMLIKRADIMQILKKR